MLGGLLKGIRVVELCGLAPVPHCGLLLADAGANVTVVTREDESVDQRLTRGKESIQLDLKTPEGVQKVREMCRSSDVLLDPFRPGVLEKMGLDPVQLMQDNSRLVVCRLTGYGQTGALSNEAGHDINYVAVTGRRPWPPVNLLADFAGGGLTAAFGIVTALLNRERNGGSGCLIDCSMVEGLAYLGSFVSHYHDMEHLWTQPYAAFGGDCPIYRTYETSDGKYMAVGALEPKFNQNLFRVLGLERAVSDVYSDPAGVTEDIERIFKGKTREEWAELFKGQDACVTPVLDIHEAAAYPHNSQRDTFTKIGEKWIPNAAPKFYTKEEFSKLRSKL